MNTRAAEGVRATESAANILSKRSTIRYALIFGGLMAFGPLSIDMYLPALPAMTGELHSTASTLQFTLTAFILGLAIGQLVVGPLSDALGRRKPLLVGLVVYVLGSVLCLLSPTAGVLVVGRAVQALGASAGIVIARAGVRDLFSGTAMTRFFSMLMLVNGLAPILAPIIGGQLLALASWRGVFVALTVFGALLLAAVVFALPESLPTDRRTPAHIGRTLRTYGRLLADRTFLGYALAGSLLFAGMFAYISGSSFVLQQMYGLSPQAYSLVFGMNGLGIVIAGQVNGRIVGRFSERALLRTGLLSGTVGGFGVLLAATTGLGLAGLLPPLLVMVSSIGLVMPNATSLALTEHPRTAGSASALLGVLQFIIGGIATPLVGLGSGDPAVLMTATMASFAVLALTAFLLLTRPGRPEPAQSG